MSKDQENKLSKNQRRALEILAEILKKNKEKIAEEKIPSFLKR